MQVANEYQKIALRTGISKLYPESFPGRTSAARENSHKPRKLYDEKRALLFTTRKFFSCQTCTARSSRLHSSITNLDLMKSQATKSTGRLPTCRMGSTHTQQGSQLIVALTWSPARYACTYTSKRVNLNVLIIHYGATVTIRVISINHRRSPLVQGGLEIPVEVSVTMTSSETNSVALAKYEELVSQNYKEPVDGNFEDVTDN